MSIYRQPIMGGTTEGSLNNAHVQWVKVASATRQIFAGEIMTFVAGTANMVTPCDASNASNALTEYAGVALTDCPNNRVDKFWTDGAELGYIDTGDDSQNYRSPTDMSWDSEAGVKTLAIITQGVVEIWCASATSGDFAEGAVICPAFDHAAAATFDGCANILTRAAVVASGIREIAVIVSGTTEDMADAAYGTATGTPVAKVRVRLFG